jgi:hypothetical protein
VGIILGLALGNPKVQNGWFTTSHTLSACKSLLHLLLIAEDLCPNLAVDRWLLSAPLRGKAGGTGVFEGYAEEDGMEVSNGSIAARRAVGCFR